MIHESSYSAYLEEETLVEAEATPKMLTLQKRGIYSLKG